MVGIYKITNTENGKIYVGQSNDIQRRFNEHKQKGAKSRIPLDVAIQKYGAEKFTFEVIEECELDRLNERESFWIKELGAMENGYNCTVGGDQQSVGINNGRAKMTEEEVIEIRLAYKDHCKQKEVYEKYKDKISFKYFQNLWQGRVWAHIMPEVFTEENKQYYIKEQSKGSNGDAAAFTSSEVMEMRKRYVNETAKEIFEDYKDRGIQYQTFQAILWGRTYTNLPIYKKKQGIWINN